MRCLGLILLGLLACLLILLAVGGLLLHTEALWNWSGRQLVAFAQDRLYPTLTVKEVRGHPFLGITFEGITLTAPEGEVLTARRVELRFSLWSLVRLEPVIGRLAIYQPQVHCWRGPDGSLNLAHLLKKRPPPPFHSIDLRDIIIAEGRVTFREGDRIRQCPRFDFRTTILVVHPKRPEQAIFVRRALLTADTDPGRVSIKTRLAYQRQELNLLTLEVYDESGLIALLGGKARLSDEPSGFLSGEFKLSADSLRRLLPTWPKAWNVAGKFSLEGTLKDIKIISGGELNGSSFLLDGHLEKAADWRYELDLKLAALKPDLLASLSAPLAERLQGLSPISVRLQAKGAGFSWPPATLGCRLSASPFTFHQAEIRQLEATLRSEAGEQNLLGLVRGNLGQLEVEARGPLLSRRQGAVKISARNLKPRLLGLAAAPPEALINGAFTGSLALPGRAAWEDLKVAGELKVSGQWDRFTPLDWQCRLAWEKPQLQIAKATVKAKDLAAELAGTVKGENLNFQGHAKLPPKGVLPGPLTLSGQLSASFAVKGSWRAPDIALEAQGQNFSWQDYRIRSARLKAAAQGWPPHAGRLDLQATELRAYSWVLPQLLVTCGGSDRRWQFHFKVSDQSGPKAELRGLADLRRRPGQLTLEHTEARVADISIRNAAPIKVSFLPDLVIEPAVFKVKEGKVTLAGRLHGSQVSGRLDFQGIPAEAIPLPGIPPLKGLLQGQATLSGSPPNPRIQGQLQLGIGQISGFSFNALKTAFAYHDASFTFNGFLSETEGGPRFRWEGKLPLHFSLAPFRWSWGKGDLYVLVKGEKAHLGLLTALSPELEEAEGDLDLSAEWRGTVSQPRLAGHLRWGPGSIRLRHAGIFYRLHPGMVQLQGNMLTIPELVLENQGTARVRGKITLGGLMPQQVEVQAELHEFKTLERSGSEVFATGRATLQGPWPRAFLRGDLSLVRTSFRTAFFQAGKHEDIVLLGDTPPSGAASSEKTKGGPPAFFRHIALDLKLTSTEGAWVKNKRLRIKLAGNLHLRKAAGEEEILAKGLLPVKEGVIELQDREFKVTQGEVHLPGVPGAAVTTRLQAMSQVGDITLILNLHGPVRKPDMELSSVPPLPPADILAYLVFGRPSQALTQQQFRTIGEQAAGILGGITARKLRDYLGKDFPLVGNIYMHGSTETVGVAKPLTKDLTVSFERKTEPLSREDTNQIRMDYQLNRYLKIESQLGRRNSGADVLFNVDF